MKYYIKIRVWDFLLCILCQVGLIFTIFSGFLLEDAVCKNTFLVIILLAVFDAILFLFAYNRKLMIAGIILGILAIAFYIFHAASTGVFDDEAANSLGITLFLIFITALIVFLLGRSRGGIIVLFILGTFIIAGAYFLQYEVMLWTFLIFEAAVLLFFLYRNYCVTLGNVQAGKVRLPVFIMQALIVCLIAFVLSCGVYKVIIKPLNPPTRQLKLLTVLEDMDVLRVLGVSSMREMLDPDTLSSEELQQILYSDQLNEAGEQEYDKENEKEESTELSDDSRQDKKDPFRNSLPAELLHNVFHNYGWIYILAAIVILIVLLLALRNIRRKKWTDRVETLSKENQVVNYYRYFLDRLSRLGYAKPPQRTLSEYAADISHEMEAFASGDITFDKLTEIYIDTYYGAHPVTEEQAGWFKNFYREFPKNTKREIGFFRYILKYFVL